MRSAYCLHISLPVNEQDSTSMDRQYHQDQNLVKIETRDLPDAVRTSLVSRDYAGWVISGAYKAQMSDPNDPQERNLYCRSQKWSTDNNCNI